MNDKNVHQIVTRVIQRVYSDSGRTPRNISDDDTFTDTLQLDSLDLAVMVVGLEQELGVDPFRNGASPVRTVGELVALYEAACNSA